jgi:tetratricopeptide (TPR) repeat protein
MKLLVLGFAIVSSVGAAAVVTTDDLDVVFQNLKQAGAQKDFARVEKSAGELFALTRQAIAASAPEDEAAKEAWSNRAAYARDLELQAEYALSAAAFEAPAQTAIALLVSLEKQNPKSKYLDLAYARYFMVLQQTGAASKIPAIAEKAVANFPENEDLLLVLADTAMNRKQSAAALNYSRRLVAVLNKHPKPEGMSAADWERKKSAALGRGYWIAGITLSEKSQYFEADKNLRAALPLIKGSEAMAAPALYYLGVANLQLGRMTMNKAQVLEAARFSAQAANIPGPYAQPAQHNALVMKSEAEKMR